jgi:hypothetical protein
MDWMEASCTSRWERTRLITSGGELRALVGSYGVLMMQLLSWRERSGKECCFWSDESSFRMGDAVAVRILTLQKINSETSKKDNWTMANSFNFSRLLFLKLLLLSCMLDVGS